MKILEIIEPLRDLRNPLASVHNYVLTPKVSCDVVELSGISIDLHGNISATLVALHGDLGRVS